MPEAQHTEGPLDAQALRDLIHGALPADARLAPLPGFRMDLSANPGFQKVFFAARCTCGTSALLSVEVSEAKSMREVREALPSLVDRLVRQRQAFESMSCEMHTRMRLGPAASRA